MIEARAEVNCGARMYSFSPLSTAVTFPGMPHSVEIVDLLLAARANVNYREGFYRPLELLARLLCNCQRKPSILLAGIAACGGGTPLYVAGWFGNLEMVNRLLDARADPHIRNHQGQLYSDVMNIHNTFQPSRAMASRASPLPIERPLASRTSGPERPNAKCQFLQR